MEYKLYIKYISEKTKQDFLAIPYYAWAHRGKGEMNVWLARDESAITPANWPQLFQIVYYQLHQEKTLKH